MESVFALEWSLLLTQEFLLVRGFAELAGRGRCCEHPPFQASPQLRSAETARTYAGLCYFLMLLQLS